MDCQNVQAAIDAASEMKIRREEANETIGAHIRSCRDCRRYSDETAVLLTLLGAQPRIEAPADFDFKLRARLARVNSEPAADETAALLTLLGAQPRIEAPADFDFKLRARLARAKSEPAAAKGPCEKIHAMSYGFSWGGFSWGQAVAATATLAVVATVTALHFSTSDPAIPPRMSQTNHQVVKKVDASIEPPVTKAPAATFKPSHSVKSSYRTSAVTSISAAVPTNDSNLTSGSEGSTEGEDYIWRGFDPENRQFITTQNRNLIGAENSASTMSRTSSFVPSI
jgi:hypothetical protein